MLRCISTKLTGVRKLLRIIISTYVQHTALYTNVIYKRFHFPQKMKSPYFQMVYVHVSHHMVWKHLAFKSLTSYRHRTDINYYYTIRVLLRQLLTKGHWHKVNRPEIRLTPKQMAISPVKHVDWLFHRN